MRAFGRASALLVTSEIIYIPCNPCHQSIDIPALEAELRGHREEQADSAAW
jgi:hypothetical protein